MRLLAFDTSTEHLSVAVSVWAEAEQRTWNHEGAGGAQASASLLPAIRDLMARAGLRFGELDAIVFGRGPGAFTGLRAACAVAQGLAFGAQVERAGQSLPVLPVDTLLAVAEEARRLHAPDAVALDVFALLDARMGEVYGARWCWSREHGGWTQAAPTVLGAPQDMQVDAGSVLAGNVFDLPGAPWRRSGQVCVPCRPSAAALLRLAPALLAAGAAVAPEDALPLYIRDKVAQSTAERAAARAASA